MLLEQCKNEEEDGIGGGYPHLGQMIELISSDEEQIYNDQDRSINPPRRGNSLSSSTVDSDENSGYPGRDGFRGASSSSEEGSSASDEVNEPYFTSTEESEEEQSSSYSKSGSPCSAGYETAKGGLQDGLFSGEFHYDAQTLNNELLTGQGLYYADNGTTEINSFVSYNNGNIDVNGFVPCHTSNGFGNVPIYSQQPQRNYSSGGIILSQPGGFPFCSTPSYDYNYMDFNQRNTFRGGCGRCGGVGLPSTVISVPTPISNHLPFMSGFFGYPNVGTVQMMTPQVSQEQGTYTMQNVVTLPPFQQLSQMPGNGISLGLLAPQMQPPLSPMLGNGISVGLLASQMQPLLSPMSGNGISSGPVAPQLQPTPSLAPHTFITDLITTFIMNGEELPYVINTWDPTRPRRFAKPPPNLEYDYYVPPAVDDSDFFGGQQHMWQIKMIEYFGRFLPDVWKMQAVPDFKRNLADGWVGFNITAKLRFCCRSCNTPWTSKQGKIVFGFTKDAASRRGWIFMKIFGQVCMKKQKKQCNDWSYQQPACYPEEIERAVLKLSDYISYRYYGTPILDSIFEECRKSIRLANVRGGCSNKANPSVVNHHRKDLCQACVLGVCRQKVIRPVR